MKFCLTFGFGLILGTVFGFFLASFLLFDDVQPPHPKKPAVTQAAPPKSAPPTNRVRPPSPQSSPAVIDSKPVTITAAPVELGEIPDAEPANTVTNATLDPQPQEIEPAR